MQMCSLSLQPLDLRPCLKTHAFMAMAQWPLRGLKSMSFKDERLDATDDASGPLLSAFLLRHILNDLNSQSSFLAFFVPGCSGLWFGSLAEFWFSIIVVLVMVMVMVMVMMVVVVVVVVVVILVVWSANAKVGTLMETTVVLPVTV